MGSSGPVALVPRRSISSVAGWDLMVGRSPLLRGAMFGVASMLLTSCATSFHAGSPPPVERLALLKPGISTRQDVATVLGAPQGRGNAGLTAPRSEVQDVLVYQYVETDGQQVRTRNLLVFVDKQSGLYQGYMWTSIQAWLAAR
jgi:hypothetical protein